jgi:predicted nucleic acid-binding protein
VKFLCDTNVISEFLKKKSHPTARTWLDSQETLNLSVIGVEEIYYGLSSRTQTQQRLAWFEKLLTSRCQVLPITQEIATVAGQWRGQWRRQGITCTQADLLIAATASIHHLVLVTRNTKDFEHCPIPVLNPFESA